MNISILTEAGRGIGFGHLTRCIAITEEFRKLGNSVNLVVYLKDLEFLDESFEAENWLVRSPREVVSGCDIVVIDSYLVSFDWLYQAALEDCLIVQLDDYNRMTYPVNLIVNPNVFAHYMDYSNQKSKWIGGPEYVIIRSSFRSFTKIVRDIDRPRLLITTGGSDYRKLLPKLALWASELDLYDVRVVSTENPNIEIKGVVKLPLLNSERMAEEMKMADVVISACGQTLNELAVLGKPTIGIGIDKDQVPNHKFYNSTGFIRHNLWWNEVGLKEKVTLELNRLYNYEEREKSISGRIIINPNGVVNVAREIIDIA